MKKYPIKLKLLTLEDGNFHKDIFGAITEPPIAQAFLAAMIPKDLNIDVGIIDEQIDTIDFDMDCDVVAISVNTHIAKKCYDYAKEFRKRNKVVVLGGHQVTLLPGEAQKYADAIVVGEAEDVWPRLLTDLSKGNLKKRYDSPGPADLSKLPLPRRDLFKLDKYSFPNTAFVTKGCPYMCSYCASSKIFGKFRRRNTDDVIEELKSMKFKTWKEKILIFVDDELFFPKKEALEFFKRLEKLNITWISQATVTDLLDKEIIEAAAKSGCMGLSVGIESLNPKTNRYIKKYQNYLENIEDAVEYANNFGMSIGALIILGLDTDDPETIKESMKKLKKSRFVRFDFSILRAYPNTKVYKELLKANRVKKNWWFSDTEYRDAFNDVVPYAYQVYFKPKYFTPGELQLKMLEHCLDLNSLLSYSRLRNLFRNFFKRGRALLAIRLILAALLTNYKTWGMISQIKKVKKEGIY